MPRFIFLAVLGIVILWFLLSALYRPIGKLVSKIFNDSKDAIRKEEKTNNNEKENDEK